MATVRRRLAVGIFAPVVAFCAIPEPYPWLNSGGFSGPKVNASVDPLVSFQWAPSANYSALQIYAVAPALVAAAPVSAASNLSSFVSANYGASTASIASSVQLLVDFGVEHGAWLEIQTGDSRGFPAYVSVTAIISEYNAPRPGGFIALTAYPGGFYRLETNKALYDGLRYAFVSVQFRAGCTPASCPPVRLAGIRAVCQVLPLNYTGAFSSGDAELDAVWYMGAWATRVNILPGFFGSELLARGDRAPPFQGDAHVAQAVGLAAFGGQAPLTALVRTMLNLTDSAARPVHDSNIATYPLWWALSVCDYWRATGDAALLAALAPDVNATILAAVPYFGSWSAPADLRWSGWDDRLGSGFVDVDSTPEARRFLWMMTVRAAAAFQNATAEVGGPTLSPYAAQYATLVASLTTRVRAAGPQWWVSGGYGMYALAAAVTGGWTTGAEQAAFFAAAFSSPGLICSLSNFDTG